jgi:prepilin-type N-terminal cleavage/methylation domain-containing protein
MRDISYPTRRPTDRKGFTLIEVLVVLTIILIIAIAALPAIRFITGSRSIESAQNIAAAMIGRARSQALIDNSHRGVFFFVDPVTDRTNMAIVGQAGDDVSGPYSGWTMPNPPLSAANPIDRPGNNYDPGNSVTRVTYYASGNPAPIIQSLVVMLNANFPGPTYTETNANYPVGAPQPIRRYVVRPYGCIRTPTIANSANANRPTVPTGNGFWGDILTSLEIFADSDFQMLPQGVGIQLLNSNPTGQGNFDRYLRTGCIMFDKKGRFDSVPWSVTLNSTLGRALHVSRNLDLGTVGGVSRMYSQFGIAIYDRQQFLAKSGANANPTDMDFIFGSGFFDPTIYPASRFSAWNDENAEETWLDNNSLPLFVDRYNGTLIKGE